MSNESQLKDLRKKFCRDFDIPVNIFSDPYYSYFYELYRKYLDLDKKQKVFDDALASLSNVEGLKSSWFTLKDKIELDIKSQPIYKTYEKHEFKYAYDNLVNIETGNLYNEEGPNYAIVSIDIRKANYNSLKTYSPELVLNSESYEDLIKKYTPLEYYQMSKIFRQLLFEPLSGKKQNQIQKNIMNTLIGQLKKNFECEKMKVIGSDEIYLAFNKDIDLLAKEVEVKNFINQLDNGSIFKVEGFKIKKIVKNYFVKETTSGNITLRNIPQIFFAQVFKYYNQLPINELDRSFIFEGEVATFKKSLFES